MYYNNKNNENEKDNQSVGSMLGHLGFNIVY